MFKRKGPKVYRVKEKAPLKTGIIGTLIAALCCFTPVLTWLLSLIGLGFMIPALDYILVPLLVIFSAILLYALAIRFGVTRPI
ncbi:MAG: mercury resistance system transport protein MerF [Rhizobiaceae bacterium]